MFLTFYITPIFLALAAWDMFLTFYITSNFAHLTKMSNSKVVGISILLSLTTFPFILRYFLKRRYRQLTLKLKEQDDKSYYQCIFFDLKNFYCKPHLINRQDCGDHCSYTQLKTLIHYLKSAKTSICMCVYMITLKQISSELVDASRRGVKVRIITDKTMGKTTPSQSNLHYWEKNSVPFKTPPSGDQMMHHKFCLIDEMDRTSAKAFFGSVNMTAQALCKNFEALVLTNNWEIIQRLSEEFEELWKLF